MSHPKKRTCESSNKLTVDSIANLYLIVYKKLRVLVYSFLFVVQTVLQYLILFSWHTHLILVLLNLKFFIEKNYSYVEKKIFFFFYSYGSQLVIELLILLSEILNDLGALVLCNCLSIGRQLGVFLLELLFKETDVLCQLVQLGLVLIAQRVNESFVLKRFLFIFLLILKIFINVN